MKSSGNPESGGREVSDVDVEAFCRIRRLSRMLAELDLHCKRQRQLSWSSQGSKIEDVAQLLSSLQTELRVCRLLRGQGNGSSRLSRRTWRSLDACVRTAERKLEEQEVGGMLDPWLLFHKPHFPLLRRLRHWLLHLLPVWRQRDVISYVVEVAPMVDVSVSKVMDALDPDFPSSAAHYSLDVSTEGHLAP